MGDDCHHHGKNSVQPAAASMPARPVPPGRETVVSGLRKLARGLQRKLSFKNDSRTPAVAEFRRNVDADIAVHGRFAAEAQEKPIDIDGFLRVIGRKTGDAG